MSSKIHPTAVVDSAAELGAEVEVGPYSVIGPNVQLGSKCRIAPHVVIEGLTSLGPECEVFQFASIGARPQDLKYHGEPSTLEIGARNIIREYVTLQPGTENGRMKTVVGDGNMFMACCHVGHDCEVGSNNVFSNYVGLAGHVTISNNVILGGMAGIHQFCRIGDYAILAAGSMIGLDVPPFCIGQGDHCHLRGINMVALKRAGFSAEEISDIRKAYRLLFSSVGGLKDKIQALEPEFAERPRVKQMLDFIAGTERGVCNPHKQLSET